MTELYGKGTATRRDVLKRSGQLGLASSAMAGGLLSDRAVMASKSSRSSAPVARLSQDVLEVEFRTFNTGTDAEIMQSIIATYNETHPDVQINFTAPAHGTDYMTQLQTAALSGNPPPIAQLHNYEVAPYAQYLMELDLEELGIDPSNYTEVAFQLPVVDGKLLGLTMSTGTMALFYNKDHFEEAGLDPEAPPTTGEEFIEAAQALTRDGRYGFAHDPEAWMPWYTWNWQAGGSLLSEAASPEETEALFNSPAGIEAAQLSQDLVHSYEAALPDISEDLTSLLYAGNVSMLFLGPWNLNRVMQFNEEEGGNLGWAKYPVFFDEQPAVMSTSHIYSLTQQDDPEVAQASKDFITWMLEEASFEWSRAHAPTNVTVLEQMKDSDDPVRQAMVLWVEQAEIAAFPPYHPRWGEVSRLLMDAIQAITFQGSDVQSTLDEATSQANDILARG